MTTLFKNLPYLNYIINFVDEYSIMSIKKTMNYFLFWVTLCSINWGFISLFIYTRKNNLNISSHFCLSALRVNFYLWGILVLVWGIVIIYLLWKDCFGYEINQLKSSCLVVEGNLVKPLFRFWDQPVKIWHLVREFILVLKDLVWFEIVLVLKSCVLLGGLRS